MPFPPFGPIADLQQVTWPEYVWEWLELQSDEQLRKYR